MLIYCAAISLSVCYTALVHAGPQQLQAAPELGLAQARTIVLTYMQSEGYDTKAKYYRLDSSLLSLPDNANLPGYYLLQAEYDIFTRLNNFSLYAVDKRTADLWDRMTCQKVTSKPLTKLQNTLRRKLGLRRTARSGGISPSLHPNLCYPQLRAAPELGLSQARTIVLTYLQSTGIDTKSKHFELDPAPADGSGPEYYLFEAYVDTPLLLTSAGFYAVDKRTAVLWNRMTCQKMNSKPLTQLQNTLQRKLGLQRTARSGGVSPCF